MASGTMMTIDIFLQNGQKMTVVTNDANGNALLGRLNSALSWFATNDNEKTLVNKNAIVMIKIRPKKLPEPE